jgi:hypothetical protein
MNPRMFLVRPAWFSGSSGQKISSTHIIRDAECANIQLQVQDVIQAAVIGLAQVSLFTFAEVFRISNMWI